jgi:hypothetical protein
MILLFALSWLFVVAALILVIVHHGQREDAWSKERAELIQRIQAPESAVLTYAHGQTGPLQPVAPIALDDDQAYEKLRLERQGLAGD